MAALLDSLAALAAEVADSRWPRVREWREAALAQAVRVGLPHNRLERWRHAPLRPLAAKRFGAETAAAGIEATALPPAPRLVLVNGRYSAQHSDVSALPGLQVRSLAEALQGEDERALAVLGRTFPDIDAPFAALNTALAEDGLLIEAPADAAFDTPLHLVLLQTPDARGAQTLRHKIECRDNSRLQVIEHHLGAGQALGNQLWHVHLKPGSRLTHVRLQDLGPAHTGIHRCDAVVAGDAEYIRLDVDAGGHYLRHELNIALQGRGARARAGGVLWGEGAGNLDTRLEIRHQAPDTTCELPWRGLADGKARVSFYGGITIDAGADGSDAALSNKNLLLGPQAQVNTQPALEIYADEVKAAHGATVGQLDAAALFYLRSRGVPEREAVAMLTRAFYAEALAVLDEDLRETVRPYLPARLRAEEA